VDYWCSVDDLPVPDAKPPFDSTGD